MSTISNETRELYHNLRAEVIGISYRLTVLRQLFTDQKTLDLLNKTAPRFFNNLWLDYLDAISLTVRRLMDPAMSFNKYLNASF